MYPLILYLTRPPFVLLKVPPCWPLGKHSSCSLQLLAAGLERKSETAGAQQALLSLTSKPGLSLSHLSPDPRLTAVDS